MANPRWRGVGNTATRRRIECIRWTRQDKVSALLLGLLVALSGAVAAWLVSMYHD
jgi:hypothetical protein